MKWEEVSLGEVLLKIIGGGTPSKSNSDYWNGNIPWCSVKDMADGRHQLYETIDYITQKGLENSSSNLIPKGTVITATRMGLGRSFINKIDMAINQDLKALIPNDMIDNDFLLWMLLNRKTELESLGVGSTVKGIRLNVLRGLKFNLPPISVQRRIASILSAYDDLIENNLKRIKLLEEKAISRYNMIVKSEEMKEVKLCDIATINESSLKSNSDIEKILYVDIASVSTGRINVKTEYELNKAPGRARRILKHEDIIWSCVRPNRKLYSFVWEPEYNLIASTGFAVITAKSIPATFLFQIITTNKFVSYLENQAKGATYPAVSTDDFRNATIKIPSQSIMQEFDSDVKQYFELKNTLEKQNIRLREARDILLPRLMNQQIEV